MKARVSAGGDGDPVQLTNRSGAYRLPFEQPKLTTLPPTSPSDTIDEVCLPTPTPINEATAVAPFRQSLASSSSFDVSMAGLKYPVTSVSSTAVMPMSSISLPISTLSRFLGIG